MQVEFLLNALNIMRLYLSAHLWCDVQLMPEKKYGAPTWIASDAREEMTMMRLCDLHGEENGALASPPCTY